MLLPWIVTSATWPRLTSFRKSENARVACGPRLDEVWKRLKSATRSSPITIQRARFLPKLFTTSAFQCRDGHRLPTILPRPGIDSRMIFIGFTEMIFIRFTDRAQPPLKKCKTRLCQRMDGPKNKFRQDPDPFPSISQMRNGREAKLVPQGRQDR